MIDQGSSIQKGYREGGAAEPAVRRTMLLSVVASILAVTLSFSSFVFAQGRAATTDIGRVYAELSPAVANIQVSSAGDTGSGVVFDRNGYVLTNYHVINEALNDQDIVVRLPGPGQAPSTLIGYDKGTDLAVLKVDVPPRRLTTASFGNSDAVQVGDLALAIGNPHGLSHSLTVGHISFVGRRLVSNDPYTPDVEGALQTDAPINTGNSGGPLLDARGQVIGINSQHEPGSDGLGFAIPSNTALRIAHEIIERGFVRRPFLGASGWPINLTLARELNLPVDHGLLLQEIVPESPAEQIGLDAGHGDVGTVYGQVKEGADILVSINGQPVRNQADLNSQVARHPIGDTVTLRVLRNGQELTLEATLAECPPANTRGHAN
ncbi:MAG: S1C family serine protease [Anaerolineae bacterium]